MGRDKVLGLSLAILLIGFAGAFCFRNEPFVENGLKLAKSKILDEGIAQRPGPKPYVAEGKPEPVASAKPTVTLGGIEAIESTEPPRKLAQQPIRNAEPSIKKKTPPKEIAKAPSTPKARLIAIEKEEAKPEPVPTEAGPTASSSSRIDNPVELSIRPSSTAFTHPDSLLEDSTSWQHPPDGRDGCPAMTQREPAPSETSARIAPATSSSSKTYTVRRGDTLSKIALHFLGDSNRYREIFEANRDQLPTQNARLKVGMTLKIPADRPHAKRSAGSTMSQSGPVRPNNSASAAPRQRQVPAQPIARTRELSTQPTKSNASPPRPTADEPEQPTGTPRFVPVTKGPFWRSQAASNSDNSRGRNLSQRPPAEKRGPDGTIDRKADDGTSSAERHNGTQREEESSTMNSDGSEGT